MGYVEYEFFHKLHNDISEEEFTTLEYDARRILNAHTTGVDNVQKLRIAFPTNEEDAEAVKRCMSKLIKLMHDINSIEDTGVVSSVSSGSESISYATSGTAIGAAVADLNARNKLFNATVREYLSGVSDANGVCLLYMGVYPYVP